MRIVSTLACPASFPPTLAGFGTPSTAVRPSSGSSAPRLLKGKSLLCFGGGDTETGDTVLKYSFSTDQGNTWAAPIQIQTSGSPVGTLHNNVFAWMAAGDDGRVDIAWYGTPGVAPNPSNGPDSCTGYDWSLWMVQTLNGHAATPTFTAPILASEHFIHRGSMFTLIGGQNGDRTLGDFLQMRIGPNGEAEIGYADSNNVDEGFAPHGMFVRQNGSNGLLVASSPVNIPGLAPFNAVSDPSGDGKYEVNGLSSANMPQLDITNSSISLLTTAPCSTAAPCYQVVMQLNNLSLAPTTAQDPDLDLVWLTQCSIDDGSEWWKEFLRLWRVVQRRPATVLCWRKCRAGSRRRGDPGISRHHPTACHELPGDDRP